MSDDTFLLKVLEPVHAEVLRNPGRRPWASAVAPDRPWDGGSHFFTAAAEVMHCSRVESTRTVGTFLPWKTFSRQFARIKEDSAMIEQLPAVSDKVLAFKMAGKLHDEDYKRFVPLIDAVAAKEGKVRLLAQFEDFHG